MNSLHSRFLLSRRWLLASTLALGACAGLQIPPEEAAAPVLQAPAQWQTPLPHQGERTDLARWWAQFQDPLLSQLVEAAQDASASVASARARIEQARATLGGAQAALGPAVNAVGSASRGQQDTGMPVGNRVSAGVQAQWELDLFGGARAVRDAAEERLRGTSALWHEARVSVAAEVATQYTTLRACEAQVAQELALRAAFQAQRRRQRLGL